MKRVTIVRLLCISALTVFAAMQDTPSKAQGTQPGSAAIVLPQELAYLGAQIADLKRSLPNITCSETVVSQELKKNKVRKRVDFTATISVKRDADGKTNETFEVSNLNGRPYTATDKGFSLPIYVSGNFTKAMNYFSVKSQGCYRYNPTPGRIDFESISNDPKQEICDAGTKGFAQLDSNGDITHLERTVDAAFIKRGHRMIVPFGAVDFAPVTLNGQTFRLPSHTIEELHRGNSVERFEATYSEYRLFAATVTIESGGIVPTDEDTTAPPK